MSKRTRRSKDEWQALVTDYRTNHSDKSKASFCLVKKVSPTSFSKWFKKLEPAPEFIKVNLKPKTGYLKIFGLNLIEFELIADV